MNLLQPFDPAGTGEFTVSGLAELSGVRWRFTSDRPLTRGPVPAGDLLLVTDAQGGVYALDAASGQVRWQHQHDCPTGGVIATGRWVLVDSGDVWVHDHATGELAGEDVLRGVTGTPLAVTGDVLLFLNGEGLCAVNLRTETELWRTNEHLLHAPVAVADGVVIGAWPWEGNNVQGGLQAFDLATGKQLWSTDGTYDDNPSEGEEGEDDEYWEEFATVDPFHPVVTHGRVWMTRTRARDDGAEPRVQAELVALDPRTGEEKGAWPIGSANGTQACCAASAGGGLAYLIVAEGRDAFFELGSHECDSSDPRVTAIDPRAGRVVWTRALGSHPVGSAVLADGLVYAFTREGVVHCFDALTGEPRWLFTADEPSGPSTWPFGHVWHDWGEGAAEEPPRLLPGNGVLYAQTATTLYALE